MNREEGYDRITVIILSKLFSNATPIHFFENEKYLSLTLLLRRCSIKL